MSCAEKQHASRECISTAAAIPAVDAHLQRRPCQLWVHICSGGHVLGIAGKTLSRHDAAQHKPLPFRWGCFTCIQSKRTSCDHWCGWEAERVWMWREQLPPGGCAGAGWTGWGRGTAGECSAGWGREEGAHPRCPPGPASADAPQRTTAACGMPRAVAIRWRLGPIWTCSYTPMTFAQGCKCQAPLAAAAFVGKDRQPGQRSCGLPVPAVRSASSLLPPRCGGSAGAAALWWPQRCATALASEKTESQAFWEARDVACPSYHKKQHPDSKITTVLPLRVLSLRNGDWRTDTVAFRESFEKGLHARLCEQATQQGQEGGGTRIAVCAEPKRPRGWEERTRRSSAQAESPTAPLLVPALFAAAPALHHNRHIPLPLQLKAELVRTRKRPGGPWLQKSRFRAKTAKWAASSSHVEMRRGSADDAAIACSGSSSACCCSSRPTIAGPRSADPPDLGGVCCRLRTLWITSHPL